MAHDTTSPEHGTVRQTGPRHLGVRSSGAVTGLLLCVLLTSCAWDSQGGPGPLQRLGIVEPTAPVASPSDSTSKTPSSTPDVVPSEDPRYALVWEDDFDRPKLNTKLWSPEMEWGSHTTGLPLRYSIDALSIENGMLNITATKTPQKEDEFQSGAIATFGKYEFTYGYAEIRAKFPKGKGIWPAFWLTRASGNGRAEIDVIEVLGANPHTNHMALHWKKRNLHTAVYRGPDLSADYHTFGVDWQPDRVVWYQDGIERSRFEEDIPDVPMYIIANLQIGGKKTWGGPTDATTPFPSVCSIDYVRVYKRK